MAFITGRLMLSHALLFVLVYVLSVLFSIIITSIREEKAGLYASRVFVCLFCTSKLCPFSILLGVRDWLQLVIVALHGLFY